MKILAYIPARSGSKGVPNKNINPIFNIPLLEYSVYTACDAKSKGLVNDVFVSSDSKDYLALVSNYEIVKGYIRPASLSDDSSPSIDGVLDALSYMHLKFKKTYDAVIILQPTAPFRTVEHIESAIDLLNSDKTASSVVGICKLGDMHPCRIKKISKDGYLEDFSEQFCESEPSRRQDFKPEAYIRNGTIYLTRIEWIQKSVIRGPKILPLTMSEANSINIDEHIDYLLASLALDYPAYETDLSYFYPLVSCKKNL